MKATKRCKNHVAKRAFDISILLSHVYIGTSELTFVKCLCEQRRRTRDGLFYSTGQIFKVHEATASGPNKPALTLQFVVQVLDKVRMKG